MAYLKVVSIGIVCVGFYNGVSGILRALGDSKTPLIFLIVASGLNVILDLNFVLSFGWALLAQVWQRHFSQLISALACIIYAYKSNTYLN